MTEQDPIRAMSCDQLRHAVHEQYARFAMSPRLTKDELQELSRMERELQARCIREEKTA